MDAPSSTVGVHYASALAALHRHAQHAPPPTVPTPAPPPTLPQPLDPQNNLSQRDTGTAIAVGEALLGALCVYRGFEDKMD